MDRILDVLLKRIALSAKDSWRADHALEYILLEYHEGEISDAIDKMSRQDRIKIANRLRTLQSVAFHAGLTLKLKNIERSIESWRLRYFWGLNWLVNITYVLALAIAWGVSKIHTFSYEEILFYAAVGLYAYLKVSFYEISRQNDLIIQKINRADFDAAKASLKKVLQEKGWLESLEMGGPAPF